jgi:hypothetical protein
MIALLGDPTLHLQVTAPPSNLRLESEDDQRTLFWRPSPVPGARYYVLGAPDWDSQFKNLTPDGLSKTEFKVEIGAEKALYQVRAAALVTTGSGSFTNLSQGIFLELPK